jgi:hypothetical protein
LSKIILPHLRRRVLVSFRPAAIEADTYSDDSRNPSIHDEPFPRTATTSPGVPTSMMLVDEPAQGVSRSRSLGMTHDKSSPN